MACRVFGVVTALFVLLSSGTTGSGDANVRYRVGRALVRDYDVALRGVEAEGSVEGKDGRRYALYGIGQSLLFAVPEAVVRAVCGLTGQDCNAAVWEEVSVGISSTVLLPLISGIGCAFLWLFLVEIGFTARVAAVTTLLVGTGSLLLPYAKFHQEENQLAALMFAAAYFCARFRNYARGVDGVLAATLCWAPMWFRLPGLAETLPLAGVLVVFALERPPGRSRRAALGALAGAGALTVAWLLFYNWYRFGGVLSTGYVAAWLASGRVHGGWLLVTDVLRGVIGPFIHPSKSLFIYSPLILLGIGGAKIAWSDRPARVWVLAAVSALAISVLMPSGLIHWGGDASWGPRYQVAGHALLLSLSAYVWRAWHAHSTTWRAAAVFVACLSVAVEVVAVPFSYVLEYARGLTPTAAQRSETWYELSESQLVLRLDSLARFRGVWARVPDTPQTTVEEYSIPAFLPWKLGQRFGKTIWQIGVIVWLAGLAVWIGSIWRLIDHIRGRPVRRSLRSMAHRVSSRLLSGLGGSRRLGSAGARERDE